MLWDVSEVVEEHGCLYALLGRVRRACSIQLVGDVKRDEYPNVVRDYLLDGESQAPVNGKPDTLDGDVCHLFGDDGAWEPADIEGGSSETDGAGFFSEDAELLALSSSDEEGIEANMVPSENRAGSIHNPLLCTGVSPLTAPDAGQNWNGIADGEAIVPECAKQVCEEDARPSGSSSQVNPAVAFRDCSLPVVAGGSIPGGSAVDWWQRGVAQMRDIQRSRAAKVK
jgi:hypothetical protein